MTLVGRFLGALIAILALSTSALAQDTIDQRLARALVIEETKGDSAEAAAIYAALRREEKATAEQRFQAGLGLARCQRRAGAIDQARALLEELEELARGRDQAMKALSAERKRLDGASAQDEDALREKVLEALRQRKSDEIRQLGRAAVAPLLSILRAKENPRDYQQVIRLLLEIDDPTIPAALAEFVTKATAQQTNSVDFLLSRFPTQQEPGRWDEVLIAAAASPFETVRKAATYPALGLTPPAEDLWDRLLKDESAEVRGNALEVYLQRWSHSTNEAYFAVFRRALKDPSTEVRRRLYAHLRPAMSRSYEETIAIIEALVVDPDPETRRNALSAATQILPKSRTKPLLMAALEDKAATNRRFALDRLRGMLDTADVKDIRPMLRDADQATRDSAAGALGMLPAAAICDDEEAEGLLLGCLKERNGEVRRFAASVLARAGSKRIAAEMRALFRAQNPSCRHAAAYYMIRTNDIDALPAYLDVISELNDRVIWDGLPYRPNGARSHPDVVRAGAQKSILTWVRRRGHREAVPLILDRAVDFDQNSVYEIAAVCRTLAEERKEDVFRQILAIKDLTWRNQLIGSLTDFFGSAPYAIEHYVTVLGERSVEVRQTGARALRTYGSGETVPALIDAIERETTETVAEELTSAIVKHALPKHVSMIGAALERSTQPAIQNALIRTLGILGTEAAIDILVARLDDTDSPRAAVLRYLGNNKVERTRPIISEKVVMDEFKLPDDRIAALRALGKMGNEDDVAVVLDAMRKHSDVMRDDRRLYSFEPLEANALKQRGRSSFPVGLLAILDMGSETYLETLTRILATKELKDYRANAVQLLAFINDPRADTLISEALEHADSEVRVSAAKAAGHTLLVGTKYRLIRLLRDKTPSVRRAANSALLRFEQYGMN
jgi:HEAT repeat protein